MWFTSPNKIRQLHVTLTTSGNQSVPLQLDGYGAYLILVENADDATNGTSAVFLIAANVHHGGGIFRASASAGLHGEHLTLNWHQGTANPVLKYMQEPTYSDEEKPEVHQVFKVTYVK